LFNDIVRLRAFKEEAARDYHEEPRPGCWSRAIRRGPTPLGEAALNQRIDAQEPTRRPAQHARRVKKRSTKAPALRAQRPCRTLWSGNDQGECSFRTYDASATTRENRAHARRADEAYSADWTDGTCRRRHRSLKSKNSGRERRSVDQISDVASLRCNLKGRRLERQCGTCSKGTVVGQFDPTNSYERLRTQG